ncbi:MAG: hypothetical protein ABI041_16980, partial [Bdellovibrionia bacterium]
KFIPTYPFLKNLAAALLKEDIPVLRSLSIILANADYPFGDPPHLLNRPDVKYVRASKDPQWQAIWPALVEKYGESFKLTFEKAWKDPRGLIWGEAIYGKTYTRDEADLYCKSIGAHLPSREEWKTLASEMGEGSESGYVPQILPHLNDLRYLWTSHLNVNSLPYLFDSSIGGFTLGDEKKISSALCVMPLSNLKVTAESSLVNQ